MDTVLLMHELGYVHRDIKPANIIYSKKDKIWKLTDFGLSEKI